jgi:hypothetical protein
MKLALLIVIWLQQGCSIPPHPYYFCKEISHIPSLCWCICDIPHGSWNSSRLMQFFCLPIWIILALLPHLTSVLYMKFFHNYASFVIEIIFHVISFRYVAFAIQLLTPESDLGYTVTHISLNTDGSSLLLVGSHNLSVLYVHERVSEDGDTIICRYVAPLWFYHMLTAFSFYFIT